MSNTITSKRKFYHSLVFPSLFLITIWLIKLYEITLNLSFSNLGVYPQKLSGLIGIIFSPLIHGSLNHIISNSFPVFILWVAIMYFYRGIGHRIVIYSWLLTGVFIWLIGRESYHIGASGLVYSFASFLFFSGAIRKDKTLLAIALAVAFMYGSMVWGLFPYDPKISFEAHAMGMLSGGIFAYFYRNEGPVTKKYSWELEEEAEELENQLNNLDSTNSTKPNIEINYIISEKDFEKNQEINN